jgi:NADH:ubiquinone oxidoreductase subunit C
VDPADPVQALEAKVPRAVLESRPFGHGGEMSIWVEMKSIAKVARTLRDEEGLVYDWLENLSVMELDKALVLSYFVRSTATGAHLIIRGSVVPSSPDAEVEVDSVAAVWPMAAPFEEECSDLFGVRFAGESARRAGSDKTRALLPDGWQGFPLRKAYLFPTEFLDIPHARPAGRAVPDEFGGES